MSDDRETIYISQYWTTLKKTEKGKRNTIINMQNWGNYVNFYGCHWW